MQKVKKINAMSLAKVAGALYALFGLMAGILFTLASFFIPPEEKQNMGIFFGAASIVVMPIIYALGGFFMGLLTAVFYNIVAVKVGGIQVEIEN